MNLKLNLNLNRNLNLDVDLNLQLELDLTPAVLHLSWSAASPCGTTADRSCSEEGVMSASHVAIRTGHVASLNSLVTAFFLPLPRPPIVYQLRATHPNSISL